MHGCYTCDPASPDRIIDAGRPEIVHFPARFEGPPGNVNGGMAAGALACPALRTADAEGAAHAAVSRITARLRAGVAHSRPLSIDARRADGAYGLTISHGETAVITGVVEVATRATTLAPDDAIGKPPEQHAAALEAMARVRTPDRPPFYVETGDHPIPGCFSCGPQHPDGLQIVPRLAGDGLISSDWHPDPSLHDDDGLLAANIIASALDCSSGICMPLAYQQELLANDQFFLLGSLDVRFVRTAAVDAKGGYRVVGKALLRDGRKFFGMSALFDADDTLYATAEATWIVAAITRAEAFGPAK